VKVLHVLETSVPDTGGYTIRARAIVDFQRRAGLDPVVVTSPIFPTTDPSVTVEHFDGVAHYRTNHIPAPASARSRLGSYAVRAMMLRRYKRAVLDIARRERPDVLHAHSSYNNAYAAFPAARELKIPVVYEVRTLWGESAIIEDGLRRNSWKHRLLWHLELGAMRRADLVVPIAQGIRDELIDRGIPPEKLAVVPNGVDSSRFVPLPRDQARAASAGIGGSFVVGFVGSIRKLEGLSTVLEALELCRRQHADVTVVIVGDGPERKVLESEAARRGLTGILFTGNVPHTDVASWYSIMDVLVYPRIRAVINERVTPLKPLEAMALHKVCVASDVGGLTELVRDGDTGVIFRSGDAADLAAKLLALKSDPKRMAELRARALEFVRRERDWRFIVPRYLDVYNRAIGLSKHTGSSTLAPTLEREGALLRETNGS
jgi:PEP-CTERM/exosortase A-associated glycosyltransferase